VTGIVPVVLIGSRNIRADHFAGLIAELRQAPGKYTYGGSLASPSHVMGAWLNRVYQLDVTHVPYRGGGPAFADVIAGRIDYICNYVSIGAAAVTQGQVKALAMLAKERTPLLPDLATADAQGLKDFDVSAWNAILLPKSATASQVGKLNKAVSQALDNPALRSRLDAIGLIAAAPDRRSPDYLRRFIETETAKWAGPVKAAGLQAD
jgi:tripartite-type tricarboxylate transporter receptor subunit TctC